MGGALLESCQWPELDEPYRTALRDAVTYILDRWQPLAIVASGSIVRGNPDAASDLDINVVHPRPIRQRVQRFFNGVPAEIFVNPRHQIERYFEVERRRDGRPSTAHMLVTGFIVFDPDGIAADLRARAAGVFAAGPSLGHELSETGLMIKRYAVATQLEDAIDIVGEDPKMSQALLGVAVLDALRYRFWAAGQWQPRRKELLATLAAIDPDLAALARRLYRAALVEDRLKLAREIVHQTVGATGFFEWESAEEPLTAPPD